MNGKWIRFAVTAALAVALLTSSAYAKVATPDRETYIQVTAEHGAALYRKPDRAAETLATVAHGTVLRLYAYDENWALIETELGEHGYLRRNDVAEASLSVRPSGVVFPKKAMYARTDSRAKLYAEASQSADVKETAAAGERVRIWAYTDCWAAAEIASGRKGYMLLEDLSVISDEDSAYDSGDQTVQTWKKRYVSSASAKLYADASESAKTLATLTYGTKIEAGEVSGLWQWVRYDGKIGFMRANVLMERSPASNSEKDVVQAEFYAQTTKKATVYASAKTSGKKLGSLSKGVRVKVKAYNNRFAYITVGSHGGFVELKSLKIVV